MKNKVNEDFVPMLYKASVPGEKIIRSSPSTGFCGAFDCNWFYKRGKTEKDKFKGRFQHECKPSFEDPWIILKAIPNAKIVNRQLVVTNENKLLYGLQYHFVTQCNTKKIEDEFDIDYAIRLKIKLSGGSNKENPEYQHIIYQVAKDSESFEEVFFLGETDNFGHWLFEFLPKLLWYKKYLFDANINVPILVGEAVPDRWLEVGNPLGIPAENFQRVKLGKTLKIKKLFSLRRIKKNLKKSMSLIS